MSGEAINDVIIKLAEQDAMLVYPLAKVSNRPHIALDRQRSASSSSELVREGSQVRFQLRRVETIRPATRSPHSNRHRTSPSLPPTRHLEKAIVMLSREARGVNAGY